jgi:hypothetical protein
LRHNPAKAAHDLGDGFVISRNDLTEFIAMGARMVSAGTDIQFLLAAATEKAKQVHEMPV